MQGQRKQRIPRLRKRLPARFGASLSSHGSVGFTVNISARGICISAPNVVPAGTKLQLELKLPGEELCILGGVVVWSMRGIAALTVPGTMGVRIESSDEKFFRFLAQITPPSSPPGPRREVRSDTSQPPRPKPRAPMVEEPLASFDAAPPPSTIPRVLAPPPPESSEGEGGPRTIPMRPPAEQTPVFFDVDLDSDDEPTRKERPDPSEEEAEEPLDPDRTRRFVRPAPPRTATPSEEELDGSDVADWWHPPDDESDVPDGQAPRAPRFAEQMPIRFGVSRPLTQAGVTENISRTGFALSCQAPLSPGDAVVFSLSIGGERLCNGTGQVSWTRLGGEDEPGAAYMGIQIVRIEDSYRELLEALAKRH